MKKDARLLKVAQAFALGRKLENLQYIGKGAFKETYKITDKYGNDFALKLFDPLKCVMERAKREIDSMLKCDTPLIAKLYDYGEFAFPGGGKYYFAKEELLEGGTLNDRLKREVLTITTIKEIAKKLISALDYLRLRDLVHRDIKPENIMFRKNSDVPVLADFGIVRDLSKSSLTPTWLSEGPGTPYYSSPEQLNNEKQLISWRTDQFSLGIVLGICITGRHPFTANGKTEVDTVIAIAKRDKCNCKFADDIIKREFDWLLRMIEPWPIRRFNLPNEILKCIDMKE